jgi:hypothetical protein
VDNEAAATNRENAVDDNIEKLGARDPAQFAGDTALRRRMCSAQ